MLLETIKQYIYDSKGKGYTDLNEKHFEKIQKAIKKQEKIDLSIDEIESLYLYMIF